MVPPRSNSISDSGTPATLKVALVLAGLGAVALLLPLLGQEAGIAGLVAIIAGTVLSAPYAERPSGSIANWWPILAAGAVIALIGEPLSLAVETLGGLFTALGGVLVAVAVAFGFPADSRPS